MLNPLGTEALSEQQLQDISLRTQNWINTNKEEIQSVYESIKLTIIYELFLSPTAEHRFKHERNALMALWDLVFGMGLTLYASQRANGDTIEEAKEKTSTSLLKIWDMKLKQITDNAQALD
jgi:hypothetical protein